MAQPGVGYNQNGIGSVSRDNAMERTTFQIGDRVYAPWRRERLFPARVTFISNGTAYFSYDDGETDRMSSRRLQPSNKVFLIESVSRKPTERHWSEGRLLGEFLRMIGGRPLYSFIRTKLELGHFLKLARLSSGSHIHLSMHGLKNKLVLQLEEVDIEELITLAGDLSGKNCFLFKLPDGKRGFREGVYPRDRGGSVHQPTPGNPLGRRGAGKPAFLQKITLRRCKSVCSLSFRAAMVSAPR